jgi:hypothetical protein
MTVDPAPPFDDVPPDRPGQRALVLLTCKPGVVARRQAEEGEDVEEGAREREQPAISYKVVVQEDVVTSVAQGRAGAGVRAGGGAAGSREDVGIVPAASWSSQKWAVAQPLRV